MATQLFADMQRRYAVLKTEDENNIGIADLQALHGVIEISNAKMAKQ